MRSLVWLFEGTCHPSAADPSHFRSIITTPRNAEGEAAEGSAASSAIGAAFERLLQDPEAEVRTAAARNVTAVARHLPAETVRVFSFQRRGQLDGWIGGRA